MTKTNKLFYSFCKIIIGPVFKLFYPLEIKGLENLPKEGGIILAPNHSSYFDPIHFGMAVPRNINWIAKESFFNVWWLGWFFKITGCLSVNSEKPNIETIKKALLVLEQGEMLGIFPEGTRSRSGKLMNGELGVALLALRSGVPILPAAIDGAFEAYPPDAKFPKPRRIKLRLGKPLIFNVVKKGRIDKKTLEAVTEKVMKSIEGLIDEFEEGSK
jgi:1-acyl-sn-glycerol-3-phosphate acyltransferase